MAVLLLISTSTPLISQGTAVQGAGNGSVLAAYSAPTSEPVSESSVAPEATSGPETNLALATAESRPTSLPDGLPDSLPESPLPATALGQSDPAQSQTQSAGGSTATPTERKQGCRFRPCPKPLIDWYMRFENGPQVKPLTPLEKGWLATRNLIDPFNLLTIVGTAGITIAADSHSAYGPGFPGFGRYVGVTFTEDMTGEFFSTFLIPSITHQDPHYHRMPKASYPRRIAHAIAQVVWTQGDDGKGMWNYGNLVGFAITDEIGNLYVPGRRTNAGATAQRYVIGLATAPIDNFITEFLPDVAKHVHIQVVVVQRIINQIANKDSGGAF